MSVAAIHAFNEGVRAMRAGDVDVAVQRWEAALDAYPGMVPAARNLVVYYEEKGDYERVSELYGRMLVFDPYDTEALIRQANALRHLTRLDEAAANYERAISIYPYYRWWYDEFAEILQSMDRAADAAMWRGRASSLGADEAEMAFEDGVKHLRDGNFELAATIFEAVLEELPANLEARLYAARCYGKAGEDQKALEHFALALELTDAAPARVHLERARFHLDRDNLEAARTDAEFACEHDRDYGRARIMLDSLASKVPTPASEPHIVTHDAPELAPIDTSAPWGEQVRQLTRQAMSVASRTGRPGRIALLFERDASTAPLATETLEVLTSREFGLYGEDTQRLYAVVGQDQASSNAAGIDWEGWIDATSIGHVASSSWRASSGGIAIDRMLEAAALAVGADGFNLVLIVGTGMVRPDQTGTVGFMRRLPCYQVALIAPAHASNDLSLRLQSIAPNWTVVAPH